MKHTSNLRNYIYQKEFKITIKKNMIDIENFTNIGKKKMISNLFLTIPIWKIRKSGKKQIQNM